jgi:hypothetical protein
MGRKALFTREQVFAAADSLAADGKEVTATALLATLGGGSLTTIYRHLYEWREAHPTAGAAPAPVEIPEVVQGAFAGAWRAAVTEAAKEITAVREKAAEEVKAAQKQFQEALESIERLESEAEADATRIEELEGKVSALEQGLSESEKERAALAAAGAEQGQRQQAVEAELARTRQEGEAERKRYQSELEAARREKEGAIKEAAELRGQVEALKSQNAELLARLAPLPAKEKK